MQENYSAEAARRNSDKQAWNPYTLQSAAIPPANSSAPVPLAAEGFSWYDPQMVRLKDESGAYKPGNSLEDWKNATLVTRVIGAKTIEFSDQDGEQRLAPKHQDMDTDNWQGIIVDTLLDLSMEWGPGEHNLKTNRDLRLSDMWAGWLAETFPPEVFAFDGQSTIRIGNIAVSTRLATPEEKQASRARKQAVIAAEVDAKRAELDKGKEDLSSYDHALITVSDRTFYLELDRANSLLAARLLEVLSTPAGEDANYMEGTNIIKAAWGLMHSTERALFAAKPADITKTKGVIDKYAYDILRKLTSRMGITRETSGDKFKIEAKPAVVFNLEPPEEGIDTSEYIPLFPPGTVRERIYQMRGEEVPAETMEQATEILLTQLHPSSALTQTDAPKILTFIMDRDGKRAIRAQMTRLGIEDPLEDILKALHRRVKQSLGDGYEGAHRDRLIAGNTTTGAGSPIQQVSGGLPPTTKWHIGINKTGRQ